MINEFLQTEKYQIKSKNSRGRDIFYRLGLSALLHMDTLQHHSPF